MYQIFYYFNITNDFLTNLVAFLSTFNNLALFFFQIKSGKLIDIDTDSVSCYSIGLPWRNLSLFTRVAPKNISKNGVDSFVN